MDSSNSICVLASGAIASIYLWIGIMVLIEGNWQARITQALALAAFLVALGSYAVLLQILFSLWQPAHINLLIWWLSAVIAIAWFCVVMLQTIGTFSNQRLWLPNTLLLMCSAGCAMLLLIQFVGFVSHAYTGLEVWNVGLLASFTLITLAAALGILLRAQALYLRDAETEDSAKNISQWFVPTTIFLICTIFFGAISVLLSGWFLVVAVICTLCSTLYVLGVITSSRQLLGRPVQTRHLQTRGLILLGITAGLLAAEISVGLLADHRIELTAVALFTPLVFAILDWRQHRAYIRDVEQYTRFVRDSTSTWPTFDIDTFRNQARHVFETIITRLEPDACYMCIQPYLHEEPLVLEHNWRWSAPKVRESKLYDLVRLELSGQALGYLVLRGPRAIAYSAIELNFARSCGFSIANLYLDSRQSQALAASVVQQNRERYDHTKSIQRVLHDQVGGNLDTILKNARMLRLHRSEVDDIVDAAQESMLLIRDLVRGELADWYPSTLQRKGLLAALAERFAQHQSCNSHVELLMRCGELEDRRLNSWLSDDLRRTLYGAIDEMVRNAVKYAGGRTERLVLIQVVFLHDSSGLQIEIIDNGVGFVPELATSDRSSGTGLYYQHAALRQAGALLFVESRPHTGTCIRIYLPASILHTYGAVVIQPVQVVHSSIEWARLVLATEQHPSGRLLINNYPSDITRPRQVMLDYYRSRQCDEVLAKQLVEVDEQRLQIFDQQVTTFPFVELIDRQQFEEYILTGKGDNTCQTADITVAHAHVRNIIHLLQTHSNYHLGLSDQSFGVNFAIKPRYAVLLEERPEHGQTSGDWFMEGLRYTHETAVNEFTRRFRSAWVSLPIEMRRKKPVIKWLETQLQRARL